MKNRELVVLERHLPALVGIGRRVNECLGVSEQYLPANKMRETAWEGYNSNNLNNSSSSDAGTIAVKSAVVNSGANGATSGACDANTVETETQPNVKMNVADVEMDENAYNVDNEVTTVLNGATFSKIKVINYCTKSNSNNNDNAIIANDTTNTNIKANSEAEIGVAINSAADNNDQITIDANAEGDADQYDGDDDDDDNVNSIRRHIDTDNVLRSNLISDSSDINATIKLSKLRVRRTKTTTSVAAVAGNAAAVCDTMQRSDDVTYASILLAQLLHFWLAFVAFCDRATIKKDDPRFAAARQQDANQKPRQEPPQPQSDAPSATKPPPIKRKIHLFTNKKIIFLFVVCVFFSCLNRIEGRPNTIVPNNNAIAADTTSTTAAASTAPTKTVDSDIQPARLTVAASDGDSVALPSKSNAIESNEGTPNEKPKQTDFRPPITIFAHDDEDPNVHKPERYPLSQVDFDRVKTPFIIGIWILSASIAKIGFHMTPKLHLIFPESCLLIVVGVVIGVVLYFCTDVAVSPLTPNTFFFYMLPPIILDAGYFMPNRLFFDNLGTILLMAVIGTVFNTATIGMSLYGCGLTGLFGETAPRFLDTFLFAALISAVDPVAVLAVFEEIHVNEVLYIVVFGESLLNDAVTVVMYHMMEVYNEIGISNIIPQDIASGIGSFFVVAIGGTVIGIIWGFLTGLVTRFTDHVRVIEPIFIFVMAYLAYLNAEIFHMSGILAITFCGITMKNYVESNISQKSHTTVKYALKMLSSSSETIIFMFLGVATVNNNHVWNTAFVLLTITFCSVFRVLGVVLLSALANRFRLHKLSRVDQFVMSYGGLRGAVAFALVLLIDERVVKQKDMFVTTTIAVIYFTVFVQGITIKPLVELLNVKRANKKKPTMNERIHERFMDHLMAGIEDIIGKTGNYNVRDKFKRFDNRFIRPLLLRDLKGAEPKIIETYSKLTMRDAMEVMRRNPSTIGQITATESMSALFRNYTSNCIGGRWAPPTIYTTCPSLTNLDNNCSRNLDMHELDYNPSKKDLTDAKIHHLLAEELKPYRRASMQMHRRLSYSRHAVDDRDLSTQVNYKMQMNFRRMFNDRKHHKRSKRGTNKQDGVKQNHVSFHDFQQNGTTKQLTHDHINEVLNESAEENAGKLNEVTVAGGDDWDDGLTFTAKSTPDSDLANNNSLIAHIQNLPGFDASKARIVQHYTTKSNSSSPERLLTPDIGPTAAESILPWRRDRSYQCIVAENPIPEEEHNVSRDSDGERRVATPTATESQLPWKRQGDEISDAVQQNEFPAWASNKEYLAYNSPSATFLGGINKPKQPKSVIGLFRRESSASKGGSSIGDNVDGAGSVRGSDPTLASALIGSLQAPHANPRLDKRSQSISVTSSGGVGFNVSEGHSGPFPVTASHRRNVRRGSMLELSGLIVTGRRPSRVIQFNSTLPDLPQKAILSTNVTGTATTTTSTTTSTPTTTASLTGIVAGSGAGTTPTTTTTATNYSFTPTTTNSTTSPTTPVKAATNSNSPTSTTTPSPTTANSWSATASASTSSIAHAEQTDSHNNVSRQDIIPEESAYQHGHSKSLCEPTGDDWESAALTSADRVNSTSTNSEKLLHSGREPLLPKLTPRAQIRRMGNSGVGTGGRSLVTTALLSTSNSEYDDDEDEDIDLYDDENIVVTMTSGGGVGGRNRSGSGGSGGGPSGSGNPTTTTIRLTHNNDESII